jgi:hypothetical protein
MVDIGHVLYPDVVGNFYRKSMSRSYHATFSQLKGKTKKELDEMAKDPASILDELATKSLTKKTVIKKRKENKRLK